MRSILFLSLSVFVLFACSSHKNGANHFYTVHKFLNLVSKQDTAQLLQMVRKDGPQTKDRWRFNSNMERINYLITKYGVAEENKWIVKYDTSRTLLKLKNIVVPIFDGFDSITGLQKASVILEFDNTGTYLPDTILVGYDIYEKRKITKEMLN